MEHSAENTEVGYKMPVHWISLYVSQNSYQVIYGLSPDKVLIYILYGQFPKTQSPIFHRHI